MSRNIPSVLNATAETSPISGDSSRKISVTPQDFERIAKELLRNLHKTGVCPSYSGEIGLKFLNNIAEITEAALSEREGAGLSTIEDNFVVAAFFAVALTADNLALTGASSPRQQLLKKDAANFVRHISNYYLTPNADVTTSILKYWSARKGLKKLKLSQHDI